MHALACDKRVCSSYYSSKKVRARFDFDCAHTGVKLGAQTRTGVSTERKTDKKNRIGEQEMKNKKEQLAFSYYLRREQQMQYCDRSASVSSSSRAASHQVAPELFRGIQVKDKRRLILSRLRTPDVAVVEGEYVRGRGLTGTIS